MVCGMVDPPNGSVSSASDAASRVGTKSGESWRFAGALTAPSGMPSASTAIERLRPRFPRSTGLLPAFSPPQRGLGDAAVHGHLRELQADEAIIGLQANLPEPLHNPQLYPLIPPATQGALRAGLIGDPVVCAAKDQHLHQLLEDDPLWDARTVASERVVGAMLGKEGRKLLPDGLDEVRFECGHGANSFCSGSVENSPNDGASAPALHHDALPIDGSS